jgi:hypothetical protein
MNRRLMPRNIPDWVNAHTRTWDMLEAGTEVEPVWTALLATVESICLPHLLGEILFA